METRNSLMRAARPVVHMIVCTILYFAALLIVQPFLPKILLKNLCPGKKECSEVLFVVGALQLFVGISSLVTAPILGGLSDACGRKPILLSVFLISIVQQVVLVYMKTQTMVYIWLLLLLIACAFREGGLLPTLLASVADVVDENHRPSVNGLTTGSLSFGLVIGTLVAMTLKTDQALRASVIVQICATIYLTVFLKETNPRNPLLPAIESQSESGMKLLPKPELERHVSKKFLATAKTIWSSRRLMTTAVVDFLNTYGLGGLESFTVYYLIARFDYGEKQLAVIYLLGGGGSVLGMTILYPVLSRLFGERGVLSVGLLGAVGHYLLYGLAWTPWMPFIAAAMEVFHSVTKPALGTMVSRGVGREQQGKVQGFMGAVRSAAAILAPLTVTPLAAASLGKNPPFGMMGFPFILCGSAMVLGWLISIGLPPPPPVPSGDPMEYIQAPMPPAEIPPMV